METMLIIELIAAAAVFVVLAMFLGYLGEKWMGVFVLGISALISSTLCVISTIAGFYQYGDTGTWLGLIVGIVVAWPVIWLTLNLFALIMGVVIVKPMRRFIIGQWFGFCSLALLGHLAGGWLGLLTITLPAVALFWIGLYRTSAYLLPPHAPTQPGRAFRSLLTFTLGTNYPYYFVDDNSQLEKRVDGNSLLQFCAGPGLTHTNCDHGAYVSDSVFKNRVFEPGLHFTGTFDQPPRVIDLRPQVRAFSVEALTKDDITIKVEIFIHFKIETGQHQVKPGHPFPISHKSVYAAVTGDLIERTEKQDKEKKHTWDDRLIGLITTPIVQDIISRYTVDGLCGANNPHAKIAGETLTRVTEALQPLGLRVIGGGIGNLIPQDKIAVEERLDNWRKDWERKILKQIGPEKHAYLLELERAKTEADLIKRLAKVAEESSKTNNSLLLRLIDSMGEIMGPPRKH